MSALIYYLLGGRFLIFILTLAKLTLTAYLGQFILTDQESASAVAFGISKTNLLKQFFYSEPSPSVADSDPDPKDPHHFAGFGSIT